MPTRDEYRQTTSWFGRFAVTSVVPTLFALLFGAGCAEDVSTKPGTTPRTGPPAARPVERNIVVRVPRTDGGKTVYTMTPRGILHAMTQTPPVSHKAVMDEAGENGAEIMKRYFERKVFSGVSHICWGGPRLSSNVVAFPGARIAFRVTMICDVSRTPRSKREAIMRTLGTPVEEPVSPARPGPRAEPRPEPRPEPRRPADDDGGDDEMVF
jgi:hypothetical protein